MSSKFFGNSKVNTPKGQNKKKDPLQMHLND